MASVEKQINARFQLKYDSYANWSTKNPELKAGEIAIAYLGNTPNSTETHNYGDKHPVLFKVGPGNFNSLPWASALAADVYNWAKKTEDEFKAWVKTLIKVTDIDAYSKSEVDAKFTANSKADQAYADSLAKNYDAAGTAQGLIDGLNVSDSAVTGKYVSAVSESKGKIEVVRADLPTYTLATGSANGTVAFNGADVAVKGLGSAAYTNSTAYDAAGAAATAKSEAIASAEEKVNALANGSVKANTDAISAIKNHASVDSFADVMTEMAKYQIAGDYATKAEAQGYANAKDAAIKAAKDAADAAQADIDAFFAAAETGTAAIDTLKEIQDFLNSDDGTVQTLVQDVADNKSAIEDIVDGTTVVAHATNADNATNAANLGGTAASEYVKKSEAVGYNDILTKTAAVAAYQPKGDYASAAQGAKADTAVQPAALNDYYTKSQADAAFMDSTETGNAIDAKINALNLTATYEPKGAETRAKAYADSLAGNYATAAQGAKADTALQEIKTTAGGGLKVTNKNQIDIDPDVVFVFYAGDASTLVD